jgi:hypothetical protein
MQIYILMAFMQTLTLTPSYIMVIETKGGRTGKMG